MTDVARGTVTAFEASDVGRIVGEAVDRYAFLRPYLVAFMRRQDGPLSPLLLATPAGRFWSCINKGIGDARFVWSLVAQDQKTMTQACSAVVFPPRLTSVGLSVTLSLTARVH